MSTPVHTNDEHDGGPTDNSRVMKSIHTAQSVALSHKCGIQVWDTHTTLNTKDLTRDVHWEQVGWDRLLDLGCSGNGALAFPGAHMIA